MEYITELLPTITLVLDLENIRLASLITISMEYMDITLVLTAALLAMVVADQIALIRGKFDNNASSTVTARARWEQDNTFKQFLKYQFFYGTKVENNYLEGANQISRIQFFIYNLFASGVLFSVLVICGAIFRMALVAAIGTFGPIEMELIAGILTAYFIFLGIVFFSKR